jgi:hypothetical protein
LPVVVEEDSGLLVVAVLVESYQIFQELCQHPHQYLQLGLEHQMLLLLLLVRVVMAEIIQRGVMVLRELLPL